MQVKQAPKGVWPVMLTPFTKDNEVDYPALEQLINWYIDNGVHGLFAVCLSSEMLHLSLEERVAVARFVQEKTAGRVPVVASGHISESFQQQLEEIRQISATGVDAFVLVTNRLAAEDEDEEVWKRRAQTILETFPDVTFGLYECPIPYHRLLSPELVKWCADTGRFTFMKECSNNLEQIKAKIKAAEGTPLNIFVANNPHVLEVMQGGGGGYSGMLASFQPDLYAWLTDNWDKQPDKAEWLQNYLGASCLYEGRHYHIGTRYYLQLEGLDITLKSRSKKASDFKVTHEREIEQFRKFNQYVKQTLLE
ncbi:dihydrodipicolinate synthase family protein [Paenibacillus sp. BIHB 4019]|uniref:Dihydrodipicolinate synthase family protein n=1 Tax=Paenibacillus sp. BIHB 4019 TaxID=1870819 RepID=A0A1B2DKG8_9BACL|nr:dihydrodipicolinate synthase family protein [Paenibacillus sp. BIHB 4019]ANY68186.1 dihydrodipicolinate synthase family protein [Paenibacillus sp. BIHB 4019]